MQNKDVELTAIGNKEHLSYLVERALNIFRVVAQNYDNDVITLVDDISLAINEPLKFQDWKHDWHTDEKNQLKETRDKCMETLKIANEAKNSAEFLLHNLKTLYASLENLVALGDKSTDIIDMFSKYGQDVQAKISYLESKPEKSSDENSRLVEFRENLDLIQGSLESIELMKPGIDYQRDFLAANIENLADIFLSDEIPVEHLHMRQEIQAIIRLVDVLYADVKKTYVRQSECIEKLSRFFYDTNHQINELISIAESVIKSSLDLCDNVKNLLELG